MQALRAVFCDPTHVAPAVGMWICVIVSMPVGLGSGQWTCVLPVAAVQSSLHAVLAVLCSRYGKCVPTTRTRRSMTIAAWAGFGGTPLVLVEEQIHPAHHAIKHLHKRNTPQEKPECSRILHLRQRLSGVAFPRDI